MALTEDADIFLSAAFWAGVARESMRSYTGLPSSASSPRSNAGSPSSATCR